MKLRTLILIIGAVVSLWHGLLANDSDKDVVVGSVITKAMLARTDAKVIALSTLDYINTVGTVPPLDNAKLAKALSGENARHERFIDTKLRSMNRRGEIIDPWGTPYKIERKGKTISVRSIHAIYVERIEIPKVRQ